MKIDKRISFILDLPFRIILAGLIFIIGWLQKKFNKQKDSGNKK